MNDYTAFCQDINGEGTIWIEQVQAEDLDSAIKTAQRECAEAWGYNECDVHVLGISAGDIEILHWEDLNE